MKNVSNLRKKVTIIYNHPVPGICTMAHIIQGLSQLAP
jgi:hypothetical protein